MCCTHVSHKEPGAYLFPHLLLVPRSVALIPASPAATVMVDANHMLLLWGQLLYADCFQLLLGVLSLLLQLILPRLPPLLLLLMLDFVVQPL